jgi:hypothetical protein
MKDCCMEDAYDAGIQDSKLVPGFARARSRGGHWTSRDEAFARARPLDELLADDHRLKDAE